jgi:Zn-dependent protease
MQNLSSLLHDIAVLALPVLTAITLHEAAHGYAAWKLGDDTAMRLGRVSFNPLRHVDPFGTIILPVMLYMAGGVLFGFAKPVPVRFDRLRRRRLDMVLVAAAGPATNILLAVGSALLIHLALVLPPVVGGWALETLQISVYLNVLLAVFNMLPLPPLDGGRVLVGLLPRGLGRRIARVERWGLLILIGLLFILPLISSRMHLDFDVFAWLVGGPTRAIETVIYSMVGLM